MTRQLFCGAGKVGSETPFHESGTVDFQLSQRAEFFEEQVGLETTLKRPIVNTRDEPHADPHRYRRLHVIVGDANLAEVATFLKLGTTALVLAMIEDDVSTEPAAGPGRPGAVHPRRRRDRTFTQPLLLADGSTATALDIQWELYSQARKYADDRGLGCLGPEAVGTAVIDRWEQVLHGLESDPVVAVPPGRLGGQAPAAGGLPGPARLRRGTTRAWPPSTCSTTTCGPLGRSSPGSTPKSW